MNNKNAFYNSTNTFYKQDPLTSKRSASDQLSENFGRIVDNLPNKMFKFFKLMIIILFRASDVRGHLLNVYATAAICFLCALFGIFIRGIFNFNARAHNFITFFIVCLIFGFGLCNHKPSLEMKRFYCLLTLSCLIGIKAWSFFEFFGFENPGSIEFTFFFGALIVYASSALSVIHSESIQSFHICGIFLSFLISFLLTFFIAPSFIYPSILWIVLTTNALFVVYDTQLITEKRQRRDTDYIWHTAMLFVDFLNIFGYLLLILKDKIGHFNNWRHEKVKSY